MTHVVSFPWRVASVFALGSTRAVLTRPLLVCYGLSAVIHLASISLNTLLPFHVMALGGSRTQVGLLFSVATIVAMVLRPAVGDWIDRIGARPVLLPGIAAVTAASLALHVAGSPEAVIAIMVAVGVGNALTSTSASLLAARASEGPNRGEALGLYFLASALAIAIAPPMAFGVRDVGGMSLAFVMVTLLVLTMLPLVLSLPSRVVAPVAGVRPGFRALSRGAIPVSLALALTTFGHSSIYGFLPLYAVSRGHGGAVMWFFALYSVWLIVCRAAFRGLSDRVGHVRVAVPAMALTALAYAALALPLTPASLMAAALLLGTGGAVLYPTLAALVMDRAPDGERGLALGTLSSSWDLGVVVGSAMIGFVADHASFGAAFAMTAVAAGMGTVTFMLTERRHAAQTVAPAIVSEA